jgi:hypothetical protein
VIVVALTAAGPGSVIAYKLFALVTEVVAKITGDGPLKSAVMYCGLSEPGRGMSYCQIQEEPSQSYRSTTPGVTLTSPM